jgi:hypothetical protein
MITNLAEVDEAHERFRLSGLIVALWDDSRLAFSPRANERTRFYDQDQIWTPGFELVNAITPLSGTGHNRCLTERARLLRRTFRGNALNKIESPAVSLRLPESRNRDRSFYFRDSIDSAEAK